MKPRSRHKETNASCGFTLQELMVVIGVIGLLAALLAPAVQSARETARCSVCKSNVRQVVTAFSEHQNAYGVFPGAQFEFEPWYVRIYPYIEQLKPARQPDGTLSGGPGEIDVMACPSDFAARGSPQFGRLSYQINCGHGDSRRDGVYCTQDFRPVSPAEVTDGLSNTIAVAERLPLLDIPSQMTIGFDDAVWKYRLIRMTDVFNPDFDQFAEYCENFSYPPQNNVVIATGYNHVQTPNRMSCTNGNRNDPRSMAYQAVTATSLHRGGVNVGVLDGAVRFVSNQVDRPVWRALGTRHGAEPNGSFGP